MKKPEKPLPGDCCGTGCVRCVYDIYLEQLEIYRQWKEQQEKNQPVNSQLSNSTNQ